MGQLTEVVVRDRRQGKTTELVNWLIQGKQIEPYPGWDRVIVCAHTAVVPRVTEMVKKLVTYKPSWMGGYEFRNDQYLPHSHMEPEQFSVLDHRLRTDVCKAVWSIDDFKHNAMGRTLFDYAIDDADLFLQRFFPPYKPPAIIAMTGKVRK